MSAPPPFVHVVLFKLPEGSSAEAELRTDIDRQLRSLPGVESLVLGSPADTKRPDRPMVDTDYDVGLLITFKSQDALEEYLAHPQHIEFAKKWDGLCELRVFDFQ